MRKLAMTAIASCVALAAAAEQPLQCVNPDIINGVLFFGRSEGKIDVTRGLPPFMSGLRTPADFSVIGSGVRDNGMTTIVAYKTSLDSDNAYAAIVAALGTEGWEVEPQPGSTEAFRLANGPRDGILCRNAERRGVRVWEAAGVRYVNIETYPQAHPHDCNTPDPAMTRAFFGPNSAVPRFQFPAGTSLAQGAGGGGGSSEVYSTSSRVISTETPARLVGFLAGELQDQGWRQDADWSGNGNAGSTWRKTIDGQLTWGALKITRVSEGTYAVDFTLMQ
ncbi:MAG TPA: hypothetical protein VMI92_00860 [Steroidobacteraceae bacterium]|nr:hypothetical protein [Steroidobacteraceae bacterium]